jgi:hypothetical protein
VVVARREAVADEQGFTAGLLEAEAQLGLLVDRVYGYLEISDG